MDGRRTTTPGPARALPGLLLTAALVGSCAAGPLPRAGSPGPATAPSAVRPAPSAPAPVTDLDAVPAASALPVDPAAAPGAAVALVTAYARPDLGPQDWLDGVVPLLSPTAAAAVEGTDPALVPASTVTGDPVQLASATPLLALLEVPTDGGACQVLLSWDDAGGRWQGERVVWPVNPR